MTIEEACGKNGFYCTLENDLLHLNREHMYYYQVQGTMAITGASKCACAKKDIASTHMTVYCSYSYSV